MIICRGCDKSLPFRSILKSPGWSIHDVRCPRCGTILRAGERIRRVAWLVMGIGGIVTAVAAGIVNRIYYWDAIQSFAIVLAGAVTVGVLLGLYAWWWPDFEP
jgi:hypothetical protein